MSEPRGKKMSLGAEGPIIPNIDLMSVLVNMGVTQATAAKVLCAISPIIIISCLHGRLSCLTLCHLLHRPLSQVLRMPVRPSSVTLLTMSTSHSTQISFRSQILTSADHSGILKSMLKYNICVEIFFIIFFSSSTISHYSSYKP